MARKKISQNDRSRMSEDGAILHSSTELLHLEGPDYTVGLSQVLDTNEDEKQDMFETGYTKQ